MKFTDGFWGIRAGVTPFYPVHVHEVVVEANGLTVYGATRRINQRGDTLNAALLTVRLTSPMPNVIRVQVSHFQGLHPLTPAFELKPQPAPVVEIRDDDRAATLTSGQLTVRVEKAGDWRIDFLDGEPPITGSGWRGHGLHGYARGPLHPRAAWRWAWASASTGWASASPPLSRTARWWTCGTRTAAPAASMAYKNIPFYLTNRGYGVFVNHPEQVSFEVGSEKVERVQFSVPGETLDYFVIYGPTPKEVLERYTA